MFFPNMSFLSCSVFVDSGKSRDINWAEPNPPRIAAIGGICVKIIELADYIHWLWNILVLNLAVVKVTKPLKLLKTGTD